LCLLTKIFNDIKRIANIHPGKGEGKEKEGEKKKKKKKKGRGSFRIRPLPNCSGLISTPGFPRSRPKGLAQEGLRSQKIDEKKKKRKKREKKKKGRRKEKREIISLSLCPQKKKECGNGRFS